MVNQKHFVTNFRTPVLLGPGSHLYEPAVFKPAKDDKAKDDGEDAKENKPSYDIKTLFSKRKNRADIKMVRRAFDAAMDEQVDRKLWSPKDRTIASTTFIDADEDMVQMSATDKTLILLADKKPELTGYCQLKAKSKARPEILYLTPDGLKPMPTPILNPNPADPDEIALSQKIEDFWYSTLFPGQLIQLSATTYAYRINSPGTSCGIDRIIVLGGGTPMNRIPLSYDLSQADLDELIKWHKKNVQNFSDPFEDTIAPVTLDDETDGGEDVDPDTGEIIESKTRAKVRVQSVASDDDEDEVPPVRKRKPAAVADDEDDEPDPTHRVRTVQRRRPATVDDGYEDEDDMPAPRRRKTHPVPFDDGDDDDEPQPMRKRRTRKPEPVEDEDDMF